MKRFALERLLEWSKSSRRKPLLIQGARQVGKTWLVKEFGETHYERLISINLEYDERAANIFAETV